MITGVGLRCDGRKSLSRAYCERKRRARCPDCTLSRIRKTRENDEEETERGDPLVKDAGQASSNSKRRTRRV